MPWIISKSHCIQHNEVNDPLVIQKAPIFADLKHLEMNSAVALFANSSSMLEIGLTLH